MTEPVGRFSAVHTIGRGLQEAPVLRQGLALTWLLAAVGAMGRVVVPILLQQAIDKGIVREGGVRVDIVAWLAAVAAVAILIAGIAQRQAVVRLGTRSEAALYHLRARLIAHIHRVSLADHNEERRGALVARVTSDIETLGQFFQWGGLAWLLDGPLMLLVAAVMLAYDWVLAVVAFAIAAPLVLVLRVLQRHLVAAYDAARERNGEMLATITEVVAGAETIRAYGAGPTVQEEAERSIWARAHAQIRAGIIGAFLYPSGEVFSVLTISGVVVVGVWQGPASGLTAGAMIGFVFLTYRFLEPIAEFTEVLDQTQTAVAGMRRVLGVLDLPVGPPPAPDPRPLPAGPLDVDVRDVTFSYPTRGLAEVVDEAVLRNVTVHIPAGQQVALVGATGSGKTTLGRLVARFADPTIGEIHIGGVPLQYVDNAELRRRLVVVGQEPFLFDDTIAANVGFARPGTSARRHRSRRRPARPRRLAREPAGRAGHLGRRARRSAVGGGAPARRPPAGRRRRSRRARAGRGHLVGRRPHRGPHLAGADPPGRGPHDHRHRPPAVDRGPGRPGARAPRRAPRAGRLPRRAGGTRGALRPALRGVDGGDVDGSAPPSSSSVSRRERHSPGSNPNGSGPWTARTSQSGVPDARPGGRARARHSARAPGATSSISIRSVAARSPSAAWDSATRIVNDAASRPSLTIQPSARTCPPSSTQAVTSTVLALGRS